MLRRIAPLLLVAGVTRAGDLPTHLEMRDVALPVRSITTPSGLRILAEYDRSARRGAVVIVIDAGAADDPPGQEGLAHLVEHLGFRSRPDGKHPFTDLLDLAGAGAWNAFTEHDLTTYYSSGATAALPALLRLEVTRALDPLQGVDPATFDVEREVVRNELRQRNEQGRVGAVDTELARALYPSGHRYGRPVIGTEDSLSRLTLEMAQAFVKERYVPHRMTLVIAGDVPLDQLGKLLEEVPGKARPRGPRVAGAPPVPDLPPGPRIRRIAAPADAPSLVIGWSLPQGFGKDGYVEKFAATVLGAFSTLAFRDENILDIQASLDQQKLGSTLVLSATLAAGANPEGAMESILDQVYKTWAQSEEAWNQAALAREHQFRLNHLERFAAVNLARTTESLLERSLSRARLTHLTGDAAYLRSELAAITALGAGEITSFAERWFDRGRARAVYVEPQGTADPSGSAVPFVFSPSLQKISAPPDVLQRYVVGPGAATTSFRLPSGLEVVLAARASAPVVAVTLVSRGGRTDAEPLGAAELAQISAYVHDTRDAFGGSIGVLSSRWIERGSRVFQFEAANGNLENALAMMARTAESLYGVGAPNTGYRFWYKERAIKLFALPREKAEREIRQAVYGTSTLARVADPAELERIGGGWTAWSERTLVPKNSVLVVSGDMDPVQAEAAVQRQLAGWKREGEPLGLLSPPPGDERVAPQIRKSARPGARLTEITLACATRIGSEIDLAALQVLGEDLRARLHQTARTSLGASYGFNSRVLLERGVGELRVVGDVDDRGLVRVLALTRHEGAQLGSNPLPADRFDLARWRQGLRATAGLEHADTLGRNIARNRLSGLPADTADRYPATLVRLTPEDVARVGGLCRRTAVVQVLGEPATVDRAVQSTGGG
jgi:zinc protease